MGPFHDEVVVMILVAPDTDANKQGRGQFRLLQPPPSFVFTKPTKAIEEPTKPKAATVTQE